MSIAPLRGLQEERSYLRKSLTRASAVVDCLPIEYGVYSCRSPIESRP